MSKINLQIELDEQQAKHYLQWLNNQYDIIMAEAWYSDRYRDVPTGQRAPKVIKDVPYLAGICRTRTELTKQLGAGTPERSR